MKQLNSNTDIENFISLLCKKIDTVDSSIHAFLPESGRQKRLLDDAKELLKKDTDNLPLFGLTVGVKDIFYVDGLPIRAGSKLPLEAFHGEQADIVTKLKNAGALILGKTVTAEFAFAEPNETVNPIDHTLTPGGSSSGSAAAVAAGLCDLGIGTQTVGSTLRPASYCGIVGFKCSYGRINSDGVIYFSPSLDTVGLLTQHIEELIPVAKVVINNWQDKKIENKPLLCIPTGKYLKQAEPYVLTIFKDTVELLKSNGYRIKEVPMFENISEINENIWTLSAYEMAKVHKEWYPKYKDLYRARTKNQIETGMKIDENTYQKMLKRQKELRILIEERMRQEKIDFWITPAASTYPPELSTGITGNPTMNIPWTFAGLPTLSIPIKNSGKLPLGLQVIGKFEKDEKVLFECVSIETVINK
jgi:Asp-tRNA(Asn)/Glu-tRNA(Gln) amidotransferase A subunit family amidase